MSEDSVRGVSFSSSVVPAHAERASLPRLSMPQEQLVERIPSRQSRTAKAESGHSWVSFELLTRAILATGSTPHEIGEVLEQI